MTGISSRIPTIVLSSAGMFLDVISSMPVSCGYGGPARASCVDVGGEWHVPAVCNAQSVGRDVGRCSVLACVY